jgi:hypothetical protein
VILKVEPILGDFVNLPPCFRRLRIADKYGYQQFSTLLLSKLLHVQLVSSLQMAAVRVKPFNSVDFR